QFRLAEGSPLLFRALPPTGGAQADRVVDPRWSQFGPSGRGDARQRDQSGRTRIRPSARAVAWFLPAASFLVFPSATRAIDSCRARRAQGQGTRRTSRMD